MVRFSCFVTPNLHQKPKKVRLPGGTMHSTLQRKSEDQERKVNCGSTSTDPEVVDNNLSNSSMERTVSPSSRRDCWKSEYLNMEDSTEILQIPLMQKTKSLGSIVDMRRGSSGDDDTDDQKVNQQFSCNDSHDKSTDRINCSLVGNTSPEVHHDSIFSIEVLKQFDGNQHDDADDHSADRISDSGCLSENHTSFTRSHSAGDFRMDAAKSTEGIEPHKMGPQSRSFENLHCPDGGMAEFHDVDDVHSPIHVDSYNFPEEYADEGRKDALCQADLPKSDKSAGLIEGQKVIDKQTNIDRFHCHDNITSGMEETKNLQLVSPIQNIDELNPKEYSIRRIEEWISQIDIEGSIVEEPGESSCSFSCPEPQVEVSIPARKPDARSNLGMEVANKYISSLTATSSSAQMVNLGLVAVPFLSAFTSLRVLNLSGNFIVRIAAGTLPRRLHMLNLSKNNIAVIEGLRDLTHLRVLDLSYNRIVRIGHGLASCSSLKELYLAGNKISDVEGLHRLLKLNVLDLRGNKISTAKGLGQLAANYSYLQSINLDGNPAQRNVGDEQLKKYLLTLLPNLVYYNKQSIKASGAKEISDRSSTRAGAKTEHKLGRRGSHASGLHKLGSSHVPSLKQSRSRVANLPLGGSRNTDSSIRRNRSEGAFGKLSSVG